jgi:hypothetical protein
MHHCRLLLQTGSDNVNHCRFVRKSGSDRLFPLRTDSDVSISVGFKIPAVGPAVVVYYVVVPMTRTTNSIFPVMKGGARN